MLHLKQRAVLGAVKLWGEYLAHSEVEQSEREKLLERAREYIERLKRLGERPAVVALEMAQVGRLDRDPHGTLRFQRKPKDWLGMTTHSGTRR